MGLFRKKIPTIILVNNDEIFIVSQQGSDTGRISEPVSIKAFLADEPSRDLIPGDLRHRGSPVMIVPDYWVGHSAFRFSSKKRSVAEPFLERKLQEELPEQPDIQHFFEFFFYQTEREQRMVHAYFLREPPFFRLYENLNRLGFRPRWITSPAFLWQEKLRKRIPDFQRGGKAFVQILSQDCYLYFFYEGHFLFSRQIRLPDSGTGDSDPLETLIFEIRQSFYHFSQRTNADIEQIYLSSFGSMDVRECSARLGREVREFSEMEEELAKEDVLIGLPGMLGGICLSSLSSPQSSMSLADRRVVKDQQWKPVHVTGIAVGLLLLILLFGESLLLSNWSKPASAGISEGGAMTGAADATRILREYQEALDLILKESQRPSPNQVMLNVARALPGNVRIQEIIIEAEPDPALKLSGAVSASSPDQFGEILTAFLENLNQHFQGSRSLRMEDIELDREQCGTEQGYRVCPIRLRFPLP